MATVRGQWKFNETPVLNNVSWEVEFTSDGLYCYGLYAGNHSGSLWYGSGVVEAYTESGGWLDEVYKTIDFGNTEQTVDDSFYEWLTANATQTLSIADKLALIAENEPKVYQAGYDRGYAEGSNAGGGGDGDGSYDEGYNAGYEVGKTDGRTEGVATGKAEAYAEVEPINAELEQTLYGTDTGGDSVIEKLDANVKQVNSDFVAIKNKLVENGVEVADGIRTADYASKIDEVYENGKQDEQDALWGTIQQGGNRTYYSYAFAYGWNDETFNPIYPFKIKTANSMLYQSAVTDTKVPIDIIEITSNGAVFDYSPKLVTVRKIIAAENGYISNRLFGACSLLENVTFEGVIGNNLNLQWSPKLTADSIRNIIEHLSGSVSGKTLTLSTTARTNAFTDDEWETLKATKSNWNYSLVT